MRVRCPQCGYVGEAEAERCDLCGCELPVAAGPAGGPAIDSPSADLPAPRATSLPRITNLGITGAALRRSVAETRPVKPPPRSDPPAPVPVLPGPRSDLEEPAAGDGGASAEAVPTLPRAAADRPGLCGRLKLVVEQGRRIGEQYLLSEPQMTIGRIDQEAGVFPDIDLSGQDLDYVHRRHAQLTFHDGQTRISVEHLGGHNRTLVNNRPIDDGELVEINVGDRLRIGRVVMRLLLVTEPVD